MKQLKPQWTKDQMRDSRGYPLTQALFLEIMYNKDYAIFTLDDEDKEYEGKTYYSLRKYYLEIADPTEYEFAKMCLLGWDHWLRLLDNKQIRNEINKWREELEVALRSQAILDIVTASEDNFQAAKWIADKGWDKNRAGRPNKVEKEKERRVQERLAEDYKETITRMEKVLNG